MSSKTFFLIEDFNPDFNYQGGTPIPLNPRPLYELHKRGIIYQIPETFYDEKKLRENEPGFFLDELIWIDRIGDWIKSGVAFCSQYQLHLSRAYYNRIKYFTNAVIIQTYILNEMVRKIASQSGEIVYIKRKKESLSPKTMHHFKFDESSLSFTEILPIITSKYKVPYQFSEFREPQSSSAHASSKLPKASYLKETVRSLYRALRYKKHKRWLKGGVPDRLRVLFLHSGSMFLDPALSSLFDDGADVYVHSGQKVFNFNSILERPECDLSQPFNDAVEAEIREDFNRLAASLNKSDHFLLTWINQVTGFDLSDFLRPYFRALLTENFPKLLAETRRFVDFFKERDIEYAVSHTNSDVSSKAALLACQISVTTRSVGLQHCCDPFIDRVMHLTEVDAFDYYFASDDMSEEKFKAYAEMPYVSSCSVSQSPHYLEYAKSVCAHTHVPKPYRKVLYIPTKLSAVHTRYFNCMSYPILWYLEYQKALFDCFASLPEYRFIYKQPMIRTNFIKETVLPYLEEKRYSNITVDTRTVVECLKDADAVIMDRPTTAFFEALMSGLPILALYPDYVSNMYDPRSFELFGRSFQSFKSNEEAFEKIRGFLKSEAALYQPKLNLTDRSIVKVLKEAKKMNADHVPAGIGH